MVHPYVSIAWITWLQAGIQADLPLSQGEESTSGKDLKI